MEIRIPSPPVYLRNASVLTTAPILSQNRSSVARRDGNLFYRDPPAAPAPDLHDGAAVKVKKTKSRNGCTTCKTKRLKCDETKPACIQCQKRNVACAGYQKDYKWRTFEDTKVKTKSTAPSKYSRPYLLATTQNTNQQLNGIGALRDSGDVVMGNLRRVSRVPTLSSTLSPSLHSRSVAVTPHDQGQQQGQGTSSSPEYQELLQSHGAATSRRYRITNSLIGTRTNIGSASCEQSFSENAEAYNIDESTPGSATANNNNLGSFFSPPPQLRDLPSGRDLNFPTHLSKRRLALSPVLYRPSAFDADTDMQSQFDEAVGSSGAMTSTAELPPATTSTFLHPESMPAWQVPRASSPSPTTVSSCSSDSDDMTIHHGPSPDASSPEMLMLRFDQQTCSILSVKDGPTENPWRTLIWPLAQESPALYHAISSMTAFHGAHENPMLHTPGMAHMTKSIRRLASEIENMRLDCALATSLALAFSEGWESAVSTGVQHLRAASVMVKNLMIKHRQEIQLGQLASEDASRIRFLFNTFVYMDVVARLTSFEVGSDTNFEEILATVNAPFDDQIEVDPLMGCAMTLFPLIGRVANLIQRVYKTESNSLNMVSTAMELKELIEKWQVHSAVMYERPEDPNSDIQHSIQTAEAYRYATLLYLHQAIPEIPSESAQTLAKKVLLKLASVPLTSGAVVVQIFPLFAASCEVTDPDDRSWVVKRWAAMIARLKIGNVKSCWGVVQEVWSRRDVFETEKANRVLRRYKSRGFPGESLVPPVMHIPPSLKRKVSTIDFANEQGILYQGNLHAKSQAQRDDIAINSSESWHSAAGEELDPNDRTLKRRVTIDSNNGRPSLLKPTNLIDGYGTTLSSANLGQNRNRRMLSDNSSPSQLEHEYTVRGQLHWLSVMAAWQWEVFL